MRGLMMEYQLTLPTILRRAEALFGNKEIITRLPTKAFIATPTATLQPAPGVSPSPSAISASKTATA